MATITEDYVSLETAKLLNDKGFGEPTIGTYNIESKNPILIERPIRAIHCEAIISAPTLQMAMKWLRKVYHIEISITFGFPFIDGKVQYKYFWSVVKVCDNHLEYPMNNPNDTTCYEEIANSYEEAIEEAIKYSLENLI